MALDKAFLAGAIEGITEEQTDKILKEHEADTTGLKVNRDAVLTESKSYKEKLEKLAQERETEKTTLQKQIEELEERVKASGTDETKAFFEAEKKKIHEMYAAKLSESETAVGQQKSAYDGLYTEYLEVLKNTELDQAMNKIQNLDRGKAEMLRDVFWRRNQFELNNVEGSKKLLNKDWKSIADTLNTFISTDEGKFFLLFNNTGGGAPGSVTSKPSVSNPWKKETLNLTEQARIRRENPALAATLQAQAGT